MAQKWNKTEKAKREKGHSDPIAPSVSIKRAHIALLGVMVVCAGIGASIYSGFEKAPDNEQGFDKPNSKVAAILKRPTTMQPLPEMPSEAPPGVSAPPELFTPEDALMIKTIDPIITGPRAYKPRAGSKNS